MNLYISFTTGATGDETRANLQKALTAIGETLWPEAQAKIAASPIAARYRVHFILRTEPIHCQVWEERTIGPTAR